MPVLSDRLALQIIAAWLGIMFAGFVIMAVSVTVATVITLPKVPIQ